MVLAQKQTWRPVERNKGPKYESTQLHLPNFWQRYKKYTIEKRLFNKYCWGGGFQPSENWN
jgi:hypothetical protein